VVKIFIILSLLLIVFIAGFLGHLVWMKWSNDDDYLINSVYESGREGTD